MNLNPKNSSVSFQKRLKMFYFHHFTVFTRCRFQNVPIRVPFSIKICRHKMCRFRVDRRPIRRIFHRFQNVPASCERSPRIKPQPDFPTKKIVHHSSGLVTWYQGLNDRLAIGEKFIKACCNRDLRILGSSNFWAILLRMFNAFYYT